VAQRFVSRSDDRGPAGPRLLVEQIEIYFSVIQRKILTPNDFTSLQQVQACLHALEACYEASAKPFEWKFTRQDLDLLLKRTATHEPLPAAA
jgi:hypothetical protein